ncbi:DUF4136 domain-containing protein [Algoriphagus aestuarii]|nr:DUF4136 domain-containing protein [Algoriphagus aestuarii]
MSVLKKLSVLGIISFIFSSCSSIDIFKENSEIPIRKPYETFVIINQEVDMRGFSSQFIDQQVQIKLQEELEKSGMVYDKEKPDLVIRYTSNEDQRKRTTSNYSNPYPYWGYRVWDPWAASRYMNPNYGTKTTNYELMQVIVDFIDPKEDKFLMTLTGVTEITNPKSKSKKVLSTVDKILDTFIVENSESKE